jgi:hypothetical protein
MTNAGRRALFCLAAMVPTLLTLVYEWTTGIAPTNAVRAAAGLLLGSVVAWLIVRVLDEPAALDASDRLAAPSSRVAIR